MVELTDEARFLLARLNELEWSDLDDTFRDFAGHVIPSMERLQMLIDSPPIKAGEAVPVAWIITQTRSDSDDVFPDSLHMGFDPIPDHYRTETWGRSGKPMWKLDPLYASPQPEAYGVRALEWEAYGGRWRASSPGISVLKYLVKPDAGSRFYVSVNGQPLTGKYDTTDAAKAAAQTHFSAAIRSALSHTEQGETP